MKNKLSFEWILILVVATVAILVRCGAIVSRPIQYDDAFSILLSQRTLAEIISGTAADTMPPLFYFILHFWMKLGGQIWFFRVLSVLLNLTGIGFLYVLVKKLWGVPVALLSALLASLSPIQLFHSHDIRMYPLLETVEIGYLMCFVFLWKDGDKKNIPAWIGFVLLGAAAMYTHNLAVFVLVVPDIYLMVTKQWKFLGKVILSQILIGLLALPWLLMIPGQISKVQTAFWTPRPGLVEILQAIIMFNANLPLSGWLLPIGTLLSLEVFVMVVVELWRRRRVGKKFLFLLMMVLIPPAFIFVVSYFMRPIFVPRGFLVVSLGYYALAALVIHENILGWQSYRRITERFFGAASTSGKPVPFAGWLVLGGLVLSFGLGLWTHYTFKEFPRSPVDKALAYIELQLAPGDVIVHDNKLSYFPAHVYAPQLNQTFLADIPGSSNDTFALASQKAMDLYPASDIAAAVGQHQRIFYIIYDETIREYAGSLQKEHPILKWLGQRYQLVNKMPFNDVWVYVYQH